MISVDFRLVPILLFLWDLKRTRDVFQAPLLAFRVSPGVGITPIRQKPYDKRDFLNFHAKLLLGCGILVFKYPQKKVLNII